MKLRIDVRQAGKLRFPKKSGLLWGNDDIIIFENESEILKNYISGVTSYICTGSIPVGQVKSMLSPFFCEGMSSIPGRRFVTGFKVKT